MLNKILIILDDCIGDKTLNSQMFRKFIFNSRHYDAVKDAKDV